MMVIWVAVPYKQRPRRVDALVGLLAIEEVRHELHDTENTGGATDEDNIDVGLVCTGKDSLGTHISGAETAHERWRRDLEKKINNAYTKEKNN
jgi:hypothetical protein